MKDRPILKYCLILAFIVALACATFWREVVEKSKDMTGRILGDQVVSEKVLTGGLESIVGFRLDLELNDIRKVTVRNLQVGASNGHDADISFLLSNRGGDNDFPSLRIYLLDAKRKPLREIELSPDDYVHSTSFRAERIQVNVVLRDRESSFTVEPFYKIDRRP